MMLINGSCDPPRLIAKSVYMVQIPVGIGGNFKALSGWRKKASPEGCRPGPGDIWVIE